ncbi:MAG: prepilin-type N-terminal cleavage/methylation domain-containing protein [Proteobacteria bacterium]|nr:MAG: prepilin-type N-terminal cleavage/methylation domain-containing protein [Pseudomonadota bacterium]
MNRITMQKMNKTQGFSLIELMVAMVIGIIVLLGLVSLFTNSSILNKAQTGLATLQENGRYAITRIKEDVEQAGRKHCATVAMPSDVLTNWDQGYAMTTWMVDRNVNFNNHASTNGLPLMNQVQLDLLSDDDQLPDAFSLAGSNSYPLDSRYFIQGHHCSASSCVPAIKGVVGSDKQSNLRNIGTSDGDRAADTDVLTVRYLNGGNRISSVTGNTFTLDDVVTASANLAVVADCNTAYVANATWGGNTVTLNGSTIPVFSVLSDTRVYDMEEDFRTVSYFIGVDTDPNRPGRMISSLYRSENGNVQQLVEGVERFDVFYLAQTQTGHVVRLTADEVQAVQGGGDVNKDGAMDSTTGCILPPKSEATPSGTQLANGSGCLWRSIYAMEIHLLLNTVNDSSMVEDEVFIYSPDGLTPQTPGTTLTSGLDRERMYRREFTATVPIRSYAL